MSRARIFACEKNRKQVAEYFMISRNIYVYSVILNYNAYWLLNRLN